MAPEILAGSPYNAKADLWSLGVLVFEALFGHAPYASCNLSQLRAQALSSAPITIPPNSLSPDCMDFLSRLLQKDPMRRISYEDLFSHPYPDLIHAPCAESHQTAIRIVTDAIHHDRENNSRRAFSLYCEALNYLIPLAYGEADATRKKELYSKVEEYRRRAQQLASKHQPLPVITTNSTHSHTSLHVLAEAIPNLKSGLEIGETGDMYLAEGNYELALEKLKASLAILIQFCEAETSSSQLKPLLAHQVCECKLILGLFRR
ncbi:serine/threonine-protein kinase ULK3-like isoform X3 [Diaphorina citri]|uniref:non-specific serine/threonine protein kinase n=1 Tax=Diaphorina citri TaxID=121845 RepID=A0A3Q0JFW2_DIACI|nr:serine/threonine-protein kinase ULK3-like isoform X3 [Diaphorina citri]